MTLDSRSARREEHEPGSGSGHLPGEPKEEEEREAGL